LIFNKLKSEILNFLCVQYSGTWFERERYQQEDEMEADCLTSRYSWGFISRSFDIERTGFVFNTSTIFSRQATALLSFPDAGSRIGMMNVTYYADREADEVNYYVLGTDYFNYVVGWGCENLEDDQSREFAWVLTRLPELDEERDAQVLARIETYIDRHLDRQFLRWTVQDEVRCFEELEENRRTRSKDAYARV
jgi:lipocalin